MKTTTLPAPATGTAGTHIGWTALTALAPAIWGTTYLATTHLLPEGHPLFAALMRSLPAGLIALTLSRRLPTGAWWWRSAVLGMLNMGAFFPLLFVAAQHLPGGVAATLGATQPLLVALLAVPVLRERLSAWRLGWGLLGLAGVALVVLGPDAGLDGAGALAGVAGAASMGTGVVLTKRWGRPPDVGPLGLVGWQLTAAGLFLLLPALLVDGVPAGIDARAVGGYLWLGVVGALLAYTIWFAGIRRLPVAPTALLGLLSPLVAAGLGTALAGEALTAVQLLGFALALTAMLAGQLAPRGRSAPPRRDAGNTNSKDEHQRREAPIMRIAVFGATGLAGRAITAEALTRGHRIVACSRRPDAAHGGEDLTPLAVDVSDVTALSPILEEADAAVLAVRLAPGEEHQLAGLTRDFLDVAGRTRTPVLVVGGSAPLRSPWDPGLLVLDDPQRVPAAWRAVARASLEQLRACREHRYTGWAYLSPPALLEPGERTGRYRRGTTTLLVDRNGESRIGAADLAVAVLDELESPAGVRHFTVAHEPED